MKKPKYLPMLAALSLCVGLALQAATTPPARANTAITVNSLADVIDAGDGQCTLREAVLAANTDTASGSAAGECPAGSGVDSILLPAGTLQFAIGGHDENVTPDAAVGDLDISQDLTIIGQGTTCADPSPTCTIVDANHLARVFQVQASTQVTITRLGIYGGSDNGYGGGGVQNNGTLHLNTVIFVANYSNVIGGGLENIGTAFLSRVSFGNNQGYSGGALANLGNLTAENVSMTLGTATRGGCLYNTGPATFTHVHLSQCTASEGAGIYNIDQLSIERATIKTSLITAGSGSRNGGGIYNAKFLVLTNVTLSANAAQSGGAIYSIADYNGSTTLSNVTIANNTAVGAGAGLAGSGMFTLKNTILANTPPTENCAVAVTSQGHNLDSGSSCGLSGGGDVSNTDPLLGPLEYAGARLDTHALLPGSPAIDTGDDDGCPATDQRGIARPQDGNDDGAAACDIGAYEAYTPLLSVSDVAVAEGSSPLQADFIVSLSERSFGEVRVDYETQAGTALDGDFTIMTGTLIFPAGTFTQTVSVAIIDDAQVEADETFFLVLANPVGAALADDRGTGTIVDDDGYAIYLPAIIRRPPAARR